MTIHHARADGQPPAEGYRGADTETAHEPGYRTTCCAPRARRAWSLPVLPADTPAKRRADHLLPAGGLPAVAYFAAVIGLLGLAQIFPAPGYLVVDAIAFLAAGSWCALNFWRCRQAHCLLTGAGWLLLALFAAAEAGLGHSLVGGDEQLVFLGILAAGLVFEGIWYLVHRTNAVVPAQTEPARWSAAPGAGARR
jgi:hypothetical protein